ncbi:MAG: redoxin domain-containing protein, partial [Muribaculaceae bacterium]|nr:redoxin domain-containing protein [Muribaculaceae bacterium]
IYAAIADKGLEAALADSALKTKLYGLMSADDEVMTAYYLISRNFNGRPLYDVVRNKFDYNIMRAVATKFQQLRPDDPRTRFLEARVAQEMKRRNPGAYEREIEATVTSLPADIESVDINGKAHTLAAYVGKGHPVLLSFASYSAEQAPAYTMALQSVYDKFHDKGLQIYQVCVDATEPEWHRVAQNLPWTSVWSAAIKHGNPLASYNVDVLPLTYVFDAQGNLVERVTDWQQLEQTVARYL